MGNIYSENIINWYLKNKRDLPWRNTSNPYFIWISEVVLQQTRVAQGTAYYLRFIERFPSVRALAEAEEDEVLKAWQGLGYYSRARNLHKAAKKIMSDFSGSFPHEYKHILELNGVGEYTAAAIGSFAFNLPYATVDGNVYRVLSRLFAIETAIDSTAGKKEFSLLAQDLLSKEQPALNNQALMEFGALQCVPSSPNCVECPLVAQCKAYEKNLVNLLPLKSKKLRVTNRYFNYLYINYEGNTYLQKREKKDIWQNLYEFPLIETDKLLEDSQLFENKDFNRIFSDIDSVQVKSFSKPLKHVLSHRNIFAQFIAIDISNTNKEMSAFVQTPIEDINSFAVSRLIDLFLREELLCYS